MLLSSALTALGLLTAGASAHGAVTSYVIAGKSYKGYNGFAPSSEAVIQRQWPDYNPTMSASDFKVRCNGGTSAKLAAAANPGDTVEATWQQWTHSQGPVMVWMYKCAGDFSTCDGSGAGWFKIDESGFSGDGKTVFLDSESPSGWGIAKLVGGNKTWKSTIPNLTPGNYLIRHELIALHQARAPQWYAECAQITLGGSGTGSPSEKVSIPGYAQQGDSNISFNINDHSLPQTYKMPGPAVYRG